MKVAIVHDYIKEYGGAERVLEALHEIWPEAPIYTTLYLPEFLGPHRARFRDWNIVTSWLQKIPYVHKLISPIRLLTPWVFENWDLSSFDVVIVSATGAYFPNLLVLPSHTIHICYCHTPPRYLYGYPTARNWQKNIVGRILGGIVNHFLRQVDFISAKRPNYFIANSNEIKKRIEKFYRREAIVIYPPVDVSGKRKAESGKGENFPSRFTLHSKRYYLAGGRLARAKRIDLAIEVCNRLKLPLKVFGKGFADYDEELKKLAGFTIEFVGEVSDGELKELYFGARALIYPSLFEDFGIMSVEAQAAGVPVIALDEGGVKETVIAGKTGVFFNKPTVDSLEEAIKSFEKLKINSKDCIENAKRFSKERFKKEMKEFVEHHARTS